MNEVIAIIEQLAGRSLDIEGLDVQRGDVRRTAADTTLARRTLDWRPLTTLRKGLQAELAWTQQRAAELALTAGAAA